MIANKNELLHEEVAELKRQLDAANAGFEEFISTAAHNLRQSLRDVLAFSQLLAESQNAPDPEADLFVERIHNGSARIQSLLSDMVDYWACCDIEPPSRTEMESVLGQALLAADLQIAERQAVVTHDALPVVMGNFEVLTKVLHHLIRNGIEYSTNAAPHVHVSAQRSHAEWVISVHDNGPGIEAVFQNRVFLPFKRLHGNEHPGNGLGLAFCRKALAGQGGRIWVESTPGAGSTLYFTVPAAD